MAEINKIGEVRIIAKREKIGCIINNSVFLFKPLKIELLFRKVIKCKNDSILIKNVIFSEATYNS